MAPLLCAWYDARCWCGDIARIGTVAASTSESYLKRHRIERRLYGTVVEALEGLANDETDAVVYDGPVLHYYAHRGFRGKVHVLPDTFERQDYAIGLRAGSPLREPINRVLLTTIGKPDWQVLLYEYSGIR